MENKNEVTNTSNETVLTVVVLDDKNQPTEGAKVSITPSDSKGITNNAGEIGFKLGGSSKYEITASYGSSKVTVPYYVTKGGATRLVVNPKYVKSVEQKLHPSLLSSNFLIGAGITIVVVAVVYILWKKIKKKKKKREV